mgnify:CR=1 FL=1
MTDSPATALEAIQNTYDIDTCREIVEHGCASGVAHAHIYYSETVSFFDNYEDEIIEYIADQLGGEFNEEVWSQNPCNITGYKNETVWAYIELIASSLVEEFENSSQNSEMD